MPSPRKNHGFLCPIRGLGKNMIQAICNAFTATEPTRLWQTAIVSIFSAFIGGFFVHFLATRRDRDSKRRELVTKHLIELWRKIDSQNTVANNAVGAPEHDPSGWAQIVGDIQLFGSEEQVELTHKFANGYANQNTSDTTELLESLKHGLRNELGLSKLKQNYFWFRVRRKSDNNGKDSEAN